MTHFSTHGPAPARSLGPQSVRQWPPSAARGCRPGSPRLRFRLLFPLLLFLCASTAFGYDPDTPDLVLIVDTSKSMREPGMDPERTSLLVSKLFADIVPGNLSVVRLLDLHADRELLPWTETGRTDACDEDHNDDCDIVSPVGDWGELARTNLLGALKRELRGDQAFKDSLNDHLGQTGANSLFFMSFRAAQGVFEANQSLGQTSNNRTVIWLSDGRDENRGRLAGAVAGLRDEGVLIETVIFGDGDPSIAEGLGLDPVRVTSPTELMGAFAQAFRRIMRAPYRIDHLVDETPGFQVRPNVATMWVVVYGDTSLEDVTLRDANGRTHVADYASDSWRRAGAYRVARIDTPVAGDWRVETVGGGTGRAYAVVQRSSLGPTLLKPQRAQAEAQARLVAAIHAGGDPTPVTDWEVLDQARLSARIEGTRVHLRDDGQGADVQAGDGRFSAFHRFTSDGPQIVQLELDSPFAKRRATATVQVSGVFRYTGSDPDLRFGTRQAPSPAPICLPVPVDGLQHLGTLPVELELDGQVPSGHSLSLRLDTRVLEIDGEGMDWAAGTPLQACLDLDASAPSSRAEGTPALILRLVGSDGAEQRIRMRLHWEVQGLSFWQRWGWLLLTLAALVLAVVVALGFILPSRFQATLSIGFGPERDDVDEYPPQPVRNWRGVGIGFYRNARAYLHPDFRLKGQSQGALAVLNADGAMTRVAAQRGLILYREDIDGDWAELPVGGEIARPGEVYRVGESGPFFRLSAR